MSGCIHKFLSFFSLLKDEKQELRENASAKLFYPSKTFLTTCFIDEKMNTFRRTILARPFFSPVLELHTQERK